MPMKNMKIIHLGELILSREDLEKMPDEELAFLATLCFAVDEIGVFERLLVQTLGSRPKSEELQNAYAIQQLTLMRVLNAKVFEAFNILEQYKRMLKRSKQAESLKFLESYDSAWSVLRDSELYKVAKEIRDKSTNHYLPSETLKNLPYYPEVLRPKIYFHGSSGNSFHPIGEELVFIAKFSRELGGYENVQGGLDKWIEWGIESGRFIKKLQQEYLLWLYKNSFPNWRLRKKTPYLEPEFVGFHKKSVLPVFLEDQQNESTI